MAGLCIIWEDHINIVLYDEKNIVDDYFEKKDSLKEEEMFPILKKLMQAYTRREEFYHIFPYITNSIENDQNKISLFLTYKLDNKVFLEEEEKSNNYFFIILFL